MLRRGMTDPGGRELRPQWPEDLQSLAAELDALFRSNPYLRRMAVEIDDWGLGWARTRAMPSAELANVIGTAHGGVVVGLADTAFEIACNSYGRQCVAAELTAHFIAPGEVGKPLVAETREVSRSTRLASYEIEVTEAGGNSKPVATLLALAYRTDRWHLGADRYPDDWKARH
jgi:acyl-CoA thioesterase